MCRWFLCTAAGLCLTLAGLGSARAADGQKDKAETCGSFGTSVQFEESPKLAAAKAKKEQKLVFVLHVSGNFEDPRFT
jgi:hypothetical protein